LFIQLFLLVKHLRAQSVACHMGLHDFIHHSPEVNTPSPLTPAGQIGT